MSLLIGKHIDATLKNSSSLLAKVSSDGTSAKARIYPIMVPPNKTPEFPYITYASDGTTENYTKDDEYGMTVNVSIEVVTQKYSELGTLAELVRKAMNEGNEAEYDEFIVVDQSLTVGEENFDLVENCFYITLRYSIETQYVNSDN